MNNDWEFSKNLYCYKSLKIKMQWQKIDLELEYHLKLINKIESSLELDRISLKEKYKGILESEIEEFEKDIILDEINDEGNNFETYKEVYLNSFYINIYSIFENALEKICINYCKTDYDKLKKSNSKKSIIQILVGVIQKTADIEFTEIQSEFKEIDIEFRVLRNCLIHSRYTCEAKDIENLGNLAGIRFITVPLNSKLRLQIENKDLIIDFINKVRFLLKGIYTLFHNKIIADKVNIE